MKRFIFSIFTGFVTLTAAAQTYNYQTDGEIYKDKDLALYCEPYIDSKGEFKGISLYPKKEFDHYKEISKDWPKFGGNGAPILNDPVALYQGALESVFTPQQRAAFDSTLRFWINVYWDKNANIYMLNIYFPVSSALLSVSPEQYARLYRYMTENIQLNLSWKSTGDNKEYYGTGHLVMHLTPEKIKAQQAYYERAMREYQQRQQKQ